MDADFCITVYNLLFFLIISHTDADFCITMYDLLFFLIILHFAKLYRCEKNKVCVFAHADVVTDILNYLVYIVGSRGASQLGGIF